jgi:valyl-tRNA synthetase
MPRTGDPVGPVPTAGLAPDDVRRVETFLLEPVNTVRSLRTSAGIAPGKRIRVLLRPRRPEAEAALRAFAARIGAVAQADVEVAAGQVADEPALRHVLDDAEVVIPLAGAVDLEQERARLEKERARLEKDLEGCRRKLGKRAFVDKAPAAVVEKERARQRSLDDRLGEVVRLLGQLR